MSRDIKAIKEDLDDAIKEFDNECAEISFHELGRDDAKSYVDEYKAELEEAENEPSI